MCQTIKLSDEYWEILTRLSEILVVSPEESFKRLIFVADSITKYHDEGYKLALIKESGLSEKVTIRELVLK